MDMSSSTLAGVAVAGIAVGAAAMAFCARGGAPTLHRVGLISDFKVGGMAEVDVPGGKILLIRSSATLFRATSARCPHAAVPLVNGVLFGDRIVCPAHAACFNTASACPPRFPAAFPRAAPLHHPPPQPTPPSPPPPRQPVTSRTAPPLTTCPPSACR